MISYQNGIFVTEEKEPAVLQGHINTAHIFEINQQGGAAKPTSLGVLSPLEHYMARKNVFMQTLSPEQTIYIDDTDGKGTYTFSVPVPSKGTYIAKDVSNMDMPGIDGQKFDLLINRKFIGRNSVVKFSETSDIDLYVHDYRQEGDFFRYTFSIAGANSKHKSVPKEWLKTGTPLFIGYSVGGEYLTTYSELNTVDTGSVHKFTNFVGNATAHRSISVTREAAYMKTNAKTMSDYEDLIYTYEFKPGSIADRASRMNGAYENPVYAYLNRGITPAMATQKNLSTAAVEMKKDLLKVSILPKVEFEAYKQIIADVNTQKLFGTGLSITQDSGQTVQLPVGIVQQLLRNNLSTYNIGDAILPRIESEIINNLPPTTEPYGNMDRIITVQTGFGGYERACAEIAAKAGRINYMMTEKDYIVGEGVEKGLKATVINHYQTEFGWIKFELNHALDPIGNVNQLENPRIIVGGNMSRHLSSYVYMITNLTGNGSNVIELRKNGYWDFSHMVTTGKLQYPIGGGQAGVNSGKPFITGDPRKIHGFEVFMEKPHEALMLKNPRASLFIAPINPANGRPYASQYFSY
jgi:hypothetical protein